MNRIQVGDTVSIQVRGTTYVGIVASISLSERYDGGKRILVMWQLGGRSYEKEASLKKLN